MKVDGDWLENLHEKNSFFLQGNHLNQFPFSRNFLFILVISHIASAADT